MAVLLVERVERPPSLFDREPETRTSPARDAMHKRGAVGGREGLGGGPTLDGAIVGAWEGLVARTVVACPLCGGKLRPHGAGSAGESSGGRCDDCGTTLG